MKLIAFLVLFLAVNHSASAQNDSIFVRYMDAHGDGETYRTDTMFASYMTKDHYLIGTMLLPGTATALSGYDYGIWAESAVGSPCNSHDESDINGPDKILDITMNDSLLIITTKIIDNCCYDFLCDFEVDSNGVLNLKHTGYGEYCACDCCFGVTYTFRRESYDYMDIKPLKGVTINGDDQTFRAIQTGQD